MSKKITLTIEVTVDDYLEHDVVEWMENLAPSWAWNQNVDEWIEVENVGEGEGEKMVDVSVKNSDQLIDEIVSLNSKIGLLLNALDGALYELFKNDLGNTDVYNDGAELLDSMGYEGKGDENL